MTDTRSAEPRVDSSVPDADCHDMTARVRVDGRYLGTWVLISDANYQVHLDPYESATLRDWLNKVVPQ